MIDIEVLQNAAEIVHYDSLDIPYAIQERKLSEYTDMRALCHWHDDLEFIYLFDGEMNYDINGKTILLKKGELLVVNSHRLHFGYDNEKQECRFVCILFHPNNFNINLYMYQKYVQPLIDAPEMDYWHISCDTTWNKTTGSKISDLLSLRTENKLCEYQTYSFLYFLLSELYKLSEPFLHQRRELTNSDIELQKQMINYIYEHYSETIILEHIAASANISRSKCCQLFKRYLNQSPIAFLNAYRMNISCTLLENTSYSITQIAISCGYNHLSYFSKMFYRKYGCTPKEYRISHK